VAQAQLYRAAAFEGNENNERWKRRAKKIGAVQDSARDRSLSLRAGTG
jgi:hypothetical protein